MEKKNTGQYIRRGILYVLGLVSLAFGISLTAKVNLGVSPIVSVSYVVSEIGKFNFANTTFVLYCLFVVAEVLIHMIRKEKTKAAMDVLQIPLSLVFTRFMNLYNVVLPDFSKVTGFFGMIPGRILVLCVSIFFTALGITLSVNTKLVPNPGDGIVKTIADVAGWEQGFSKNVFDGCCIVTAILLGLIFERRVIGIGIGTVMAVFITGRFVALINHFILDRIKKASGLAK